MTQAQLWQPLLQSLVSSQLPEALASAVGLTIILDKTPQLEPILAADLQVRPFNHWPDR
jgi:lambda repressor-like predicted transcriptional regulator